MNALEDFGLKDLRAVVTGGASGIGRATAELFARTGARVLIADLDGERARHVARLIGAQADARPCDVGDELSVQALFAHAVEQMGGVDVVANVAAYRRKADTMTMPLEEWDVMHDVTVRGVFLCMREAIRVMSLQEQGGVIVNVSSVSAKHPTIFRNMHYDSAKAGVDAITRAAAVEFAPKIRVNSVQPGGTASPGAAAMQSDFVAVGPMTGTGRIPLGRMSDPIEQARAILFLASPASSYITGHHLTVDGGYHVS